MRPAFAPRPPRDGNGRRRDSNGTDTVEPVRFVQRAPGLTLAGGNTCGLPNAGQATASGVPGQVWVTVTQGGTELWKFLAVRPAASSGLRGSGLELRFVD